MSLELHKPGSRVNTAAEQRAREHILNYNAVERYRPLSSVVKSSLAGSSELLQICHGARLSQFLLHDGAKQHWVAVVDRGY